MQNPEDITRILFEGFPTWMLVTFYCAAVTTIGFFIFGCYIHVRKYRRGKPSVSRNLGTGLREMSKAVLSHRTIRRRDLFAGYSHAMIFFGFAVLFIGTSVITLEYDILQPLAGIQFWYGSFYLWFSLFVDIAGLALVVGLMLMMFRRKWFRLPKLDYTRPDRNPGDSDYNRAAYCREDWLLLWVLVLIGVSGFALEADRIIWLQLDPTVWDHRWWSPVGTSLAYAMQGVGLSPDGAEELRYFLWWLHGLLAFLFIAALPFSKAKHVFSGIASLSIRQLQPAAHLPKADLESEVIGYQEITDLSWRHLVQLDACTRCGRCHEACPANATGFPLSPRDLVLSLRELAADTLGKSLTVAGPEMRTTGNGINQVRSETLWSCRTCAACVEICPVGIEHVPMIVEMRRSLVESGEMEPTLQSALQQIQAKGNSFGENKRKRAAWTKNLDFKIKDARKESVDVLWFVGDFASLDPGYQKVSMAFARILAGAGIDFGILYEAELNSGNDVRRVGEEGLYEHLAESNIDSFDGCEFERIVTTDPHSFNTLKNEYPDFGGKFKIEHASIFIRNLLDEGLIPLARNLDYRVTYHDSCHLGRLNRGFSPPREVLAQLGAELVEMDRVRENSFCCGAGGGRIWMADPTEMQKPSENRIREAAAIKGLEVLVVSCPKCMNMLDDAAKSTGNQNNFKIKELIELVDEAMTSDSVATTVVESDKRV
mgnify:CR=1 FL=1